MYVIAATIILAIVLSYYIFSKTEKFGNFGAAPPKTGYHSMPFSGSKLSVPFGFEQKIMKTQKTNEKTLDNGLVLF